MGLAGAALDRSGWKREWFGCADAETLAVAGECNGHLMEQLLKATGYNDCACVELLRDGACLLVL